MEKQGATDFEVAEEATLLRPTSTVGALREAGRFPISDYSLS